MTEKEYNKPEEIYSKVFRAGRRTYFFDVRETKAGDYYLTITESKKNMNEDGTFHYKKHKIYLYKEDFGKFKELLDDVTDFIIREKGEEVISEKHQKDFNPVMEEKAAEVNKEAKEDAEEKEENLNTNDFTDVNFDDI
jgi:hypothetical protein